MADNTTVKNASGSTVTVRTYEDGSNVHTPAYLMEAKAGATGDVHEPASNTAAVVTYTAVASTYHYIGYIYWSYDGTPTGGSITVTDAGDTVFKVDITNAGPGFLPLVPPLKSAVANTAMVVTLAAGGSGISGIVSVRHWTEDS